MPKEITRMIVALKDIRIGEDFNGRKDAARDIDGLAASIKELGLVQPLVVREGGPSKTDGGRTYFLVAGERRYHAITKLGLKQVEIKLVKGNSQDAALLNLVENAQRLNLEPLEEAKQFVHVMQRFKMTQAQLAKKTGKSEPYISQRLSLLKNASPEVKAAVEKGSITATHAREMVTLPPEQQKEMIEEIEAKKKNGKKVSVAEVKEAADTRKATNGVKRNGKKAPVYDQEKLKLGRELLEGHKAACRPLSAIVEQMGALAQKSERASSDVTKQTIKHQMAALEWVTHVRDAL